MAKNGNQTDHTANTKKKKVNKDLVIRARVTAEERELFEKKAEERGFSTVSEMILCHVYTPIILHRLCTL